MVVDQNKQYVYVRKLIMMTIMGLTTNENLYKRRMFRKTIYLDLVTQIMRTCTHDKYLPRIYNVFLKM